jgi:hypothetical protein
MNITTGIQTAGGVMTGFLSTIVFNDLTIPFFGVHLTVITMAAGGAIVSFAYGDPITSRKKLYTLAVANTFLASISVAVLPAALGWEWVNNGLQPALAALIAVGARWFVPSMISIIPEFLRKIFRLDKKETPSASPKDGE